MKNLLSLFALCFFLACHSAQAQLKNFLNNFEPLGSNIMEVTQASQALMNNKPLPKTEWKFLFDEGWENDAVFSKIGYIYPIGKAVHNATYTTVVCLELKEGGYFFLTAYCFDVLKGKRIINQNILMFDSGKNPEQMAEKINRYSFVMDLESYTFYMNKSVDGTFKTLYTYTLNPEKEWYENTIKEF